MSSEREWEKRLSILSDACQLNTQHPLFRCADEALSVIQERANSLKPSPVPDNEYARVAASLLNDDEKEAIDWSPRGDTQEAFDMTKPTKIEIYGSYVDSEGFVCDATFDAGVNSVDVAVEVDRSMFRRQDFANHRVFDKLDLYTFFLYKHLRLGKLTMKDRIYSLQLKLTHDQSLLSPPSIVASFIKLKTNRPAPFTLKLRVLLSADQFPIHRLAPSKCCLRHLTSAQTPMYNASIVHLTRRIHITEMVTLIASRIEHFKPAVRILKFWLHRKIPPAEPYFSSIKGFHITILLAHICQSRLAVAKQASVYNLIKLFFSVVSHLHGSDVIGTISNKTDNHLVGPHDNYVLHDDSKKLYNCLYDLRGSWSELRALAKEAIAILNPRPDGPFAEDIDGLLEALVARRENLSLYCDAFVEIGNLSPWTTNETHSISQLDRVIGNLLNDLQQAFGSDKSIVAVALRYRFLNDAKHGSSPLLQARLGLKLRCTDLRLHRPYLLGPGIDDEEASARFKLFWRDKATIQQLPDARSVVCVKWKKASTFAKQPLNELLEAQPAPLTQTLRWLVQSDKALRDEKIEIISGFRLSDVPTADVKERALLDAVQDLQSRLSSLDALGIRRVSFGSSQMRFMALPVERRTRVHWDSRGSLVDDFSRLNIHNDKIEVLLELSHDVRKWKDAPEWARMAKLACLLSVQKELQKQSIGITATAINEAREFLDVHLKLKDEDSSSITCRLQIASETFERNAPWITDGNCPLPDDDALQKYRVSYYLPKHHSFVEASTTKYPALLGTIRLLKWWAAMQWISSDACEEFWELLAATVFFSSERSLKPQPSTKDPDTLEAEELERTDTFATIATPNVGFWRTLKLITMVKKGTPILCGDFSYAERLLILNNWGSTRQAFFPIITKYDPRGIFTISPSPTESRRLLRLAQEALSRCSFPNLSKSALSDVFGLDTGVFDGMIWLKSPRDLLRVEEGSKERQKILAEITNLPTRFTRKAGDIMAEAMTNKIHLDLGLLLREAFETCYTDLRSEVHKKTLFFRDPYALPYPCLIGFILPEPSAREDVEKLILRTLGDFVTHVVTNQDEEKWAHHCRLAAQLLDDGLATRVSDQ